MGSATSKIIIRMGSHAEKEYLEKTIHLLDGLIIGANLVEATPGATASLLVKFGGKKLDRPFFLDPMTYAFGSYVDATTGAVRTDLDWIKSDQKVRKSGGIIRDFKRSYKKLAEALGDPFVTALNRSTSVGANDFSDDKICREICQRIADYQLSRIENEFKVDEEYALLAENLPCPSAIFAPYFYIEPKKSKTWTDLAIKLMAMTASLGLKQPVHGAICADVEFLKDNDFTNRLKDELPDTGLDAVWFWFSRFNEHAADLNTLKSFRGLVEHFANKGIEVYNMHGGYFSLALSKHGLSGTSHGVGYGEQKDVMPVIGQSTPTVRYYLPEIHTKVGVPAVERCFKSLGVRKPSDFHNLVCNCVVCKGVVKTSVDDFQEFGEKHFSTPASKREAQTPAAAKRCRFHFLLSRIRERDSMKTSSLDDLLKMLVAENSKWSKFLSLSSNCEHLPRWLETLK